MLSDGLYASCCFAKFGVFCKNLKMVQFAVLRLDCVCSWHKSV